MGRKVAMVISSTIFRDEELFIPKKVMEDAGVSVLVASSKMTTSKGRMGQGATPDLLIGELDGRELDGIVFVGGAGAKEYWTDPVAHRLAKEMSGSGKVVAAICIAPVTLLEAGLLKGRRATSFSSEVEKLKAGGAIVQSESVVKDGNIVTANGPEAAKRFGEVLCESLGV